MIDTVNPEGLGRFVAAIAGSSSPYPTLSNPSWQTYWIDRNQSYTDSGASAKAAAGQSVYTIKIPTAWGGATFNLQQPTAGLRPTYQTDGLQGNGTSTIMNLPVAFALSGDYTYYFVQKSNAATNVVGLATNGTPSVFDCIGHDNADNNCYAIDTAISLYNPAADRSYCIRRFRRTGGNTYHKKPGVGETSIAAALGTINLGCFMSRQGSVIYNDSTARVCQIVLVTANLTPGSADDLAIRNALLALEPGVTDCG